MTTPWTVLEPRLARTRRGPKADVIETARVMHDAHCTAGRYCPPAHWEAYYHAAEAVIIFLFREDGTDA